jgi:zinc transporter 2
MASYQQSSKESAEETQRKDVLRRLYMATGLCSTFLIIEVIGGYLSGSLAVLSDAAHLFADLASFAIAIIANHLASLPATDQHTFGLKRSESLAALFSMLSLALVSLWLAAEAINRLLHSNANVDGKLMSGIAAIGVLVNIALAFVLGVENHIHLPGYHGHDHSHGHDGHCSSHDHADVGHAHDEKSKAVATSHSNGDSGCSSSNGHEHSHSHTAVAPEVVTEKTPLTSSGGHEHSHTHTTPAPVVVVTETTALTSGHEHAHGHSGAPCTGSHGVQVDKFLPVEDIQHDEHEAPLARNVNLHAAYLHVLGDLAQSVAVLIAGLAIWYNPKWRIVDTISTLFFCAFVFYSTLGVLRSSIAVLLEEVPADINWRDMLESIQAVDGIENVHDLHIWSISHGQPTLSVHCSTLGDAEKVLVDVYRVIKKMGIRHATVQVQGNGLECVTCSDSPCDEQRLSVIIPPGSEVV